MSIALDQAEERSGVTERDAALRVAIQASPAGLPMAPPVDPPALLSRSSRVVYLVVAAGLMGLADLGITMTYLTSVGMYEGNPIARFVIGFGSPALLVAFKLGTMLTTVWIVLAQRRRWQAEVAAWICFAVLAALTIQWIQYIGYTQQRHDIITTVAFDPSFAAGSWVSLR